MNRLFTLSFLLITTQMIFPQNPRLTLSSDDVIIDRVKNGYALYVRKKGDIDNVSLFVGLDDKKMYNLTREDNSLIEFKEIVKHKILGEAFYAIIPFNSFLNGNKFVIKENLDIAIESSSGNYKKNNNITLQTKVIKNNETSISIEGVEDGIDYAALYLLYSGGDNDEYAFYFREGRESRSYKLLPTIWGIDDKDAVAVILKNTYIESIGKQLLIKVYFKKTQNERYIGFNVFDKSGKATTSQVEYVLNGYTPPVVDNIIDSPLNRDSVIKAIKVNETMHVDRIDNKTNTRIENNILVKPSISKEPQKDNNPKVDIIKNQNVDNFEKNAKILTKNMELPDILEKTIIDNNTSMDLVIVLDTTMSMDEVMAILKSSIQELSKKVFEHYDYARIGFVLFKDIGSEYVTKVIPYMRDYRDVVAHVKYFSAYNGGDIPEPIYEALDVALTRFDFKSKRKLALIITDTVSKVISDATLESTTNKAKRLGVEVRMIKTRPNMRTINDIEKEILKY